MLIFFRINEWAGFRAPGLVAKQSKEAFLSLFHKTDTTDYDSEPGISRPFAHFSELIKASSAQRHDATTSELCTWKVVILSVVSGPQINSPEIYT